MANAEATRTTGGESTDAAGLLGRARAWRPRLEERADEIERARRLPDDLAKELAADGFYRMWVPRGLGGLELPLVPSLEALEALAQGDASAAWCVAIGITSSLALPSLPEPAARTVFAAPETILAGVYAPTGRAEADGDDFVVDGRWAFGSGASNAAWVLAGCRFFADGEPLLDEHDRPRSHMVLVPRGELELIDNWDVSGLRGTGSSDFELHGVRVARDFIPGFAPGPRPPGPLYRIPQLTLLAVGFGAISLGLARAALDELAELAGRKKGVGSSRRLAERSEVQSAFARAEASLRAARHHYYGSAAALYAAAEAGAPDVDRRVDLRLATCHAVETGAEVATTAYRLGGGSSIYAASRLQRCFRDAHVIPQHVQVRSELYAVMGSHLLGAPRGVEVL